MVGGGDALMSLQVRSEEKRLEADFGEEYLAYKKTTGRFVTASLPYLLPIRSVVFILVFGIGAAVVGQDIDGISNWWSIVAPSSHGFMPNTRIGG